MPASGVDVVARLRLNAEQFSSEAGRAANTISDKMRRAAEDLPRAFNQSFAEVEKLARRALTLPRTAGGSLDLSSEIGQLRNAALASDQRATALRELEAAQRSAANAARGNIAVLRQEADAAMAAALEEDRLASEYRQRIVTLEAVQAELNRTISATRQLTTAEEQALAAQRAHGQGFVMVGQQLNDFAVQVGAGQSAVTAFIQQFPQLTYALSTMEGRAGAVGAALVGPLGTGLTIAAVLAAPIIARMLDGASATEELADKLDKVRAADSGLSEAHSVLGQMFDLVTGKVKDQTGALADQNEIIRINIQLKALQLRAEGMSEASKAQEAFGNAGVRTWWGAWDDASRAMNPDLGGGASPADIAQRKRQNLVTQLRGGTLDPALAMRKASEIGDADGSLKVSAVDFVQAVADFVQGPMKQEMADRLEKTLDTGKLDPMFRETKNKRPPKPKDYTRTDNAAEEELQRINSAWDDQPKLIDRARADLLKLDNLYEVLSKRKLTPEVEALLAKIGEVRETIQNGMDRPYRDFVQRQRESLAVGTLISQGREVEADAMRDALNLQQQLGRALRDDELRTVLELAKQHERIARAIDDQRRVMGLYTAAAANVQRSFDQLLSDLDGNTGAALKNFAGNILGSFNQLRNSILSDQLFGGLQRDIEDFLRQRSGGKTPAELLNAQVGDVGAELRKRVDDSGSALEAFVSAVHGATQSITGAALGSPMNPYTTASSLDLPAEVMDRLRYDIHEMLDPIGEIIVTASKAARDTGRPSAANENRLSANDAYQFMAERTMSRLETLVGVHLPENLQRTLTKGLGTVLTGASYGQLGGNVFASLTGGKDNKFASSVGGVLGEVAGKAVGKAIGTGASGLLKTLGGAAGPLGSILGGVLGNLVGGLFNKPKWSDTQLVLNPYGQVQGGTGSGRGSAEIAAATNSANSVASAVNSIVQQLGATVQGLAPMTLGTWDGKYRVALGSTNEALNANSALGRAGLIQDFGGDQEAAIKYAVAYQLSHAVITGISEASKRILASGQDINSALTKVMAIESIPKDLKAMLDPVGAAIDELNRKWKQTVNALDEGGASAEQRAQAERLYNLQLEQVKNSTASATQGLKDFLNALGVGSNSPLSLRDQEAAAKAQLQPFLDAIGAGKSIDQSKYQSAAQSFLDVERQLYGSGGQYFDAFEMVRTATNAAISAIDNVAPIGTPVESPFAKKTAESTEATAEINAEMRDLLARMTALMERVANNTDGGGSGFLNEQRGFG